MKKATDILQQYWGYPEFRPQQAEIIEATVRGEDVLALLPTGGGKSICFQVPALMQEGICLVVSPLIALIKDQVEQLTKRKIPAVAIYSGMNKREIDIVLDNCIYGNFKFLYVSPERLKTDIFIERFKRMHVNLIAIDEAHCISQWGHDFRPSYLEIALIRELKPELNVLALTASADNKVCEDITKYLELKNVLLFKKSFYRGNLFYAVRKAESKNNKCVEILNSIAGSAIVYVNTRKAAKEVTLFLQKSGIYADFYHGGLNQATRNTKQFNWINNQTRVMVATNAFGMGIDKPDVRLVVHMELPNCMESYYQEAGRAGRDENNAFPVLLYQEVDFERLKQKTLDAHPSVDTIKRVYQALANYFKLAVGSAGGQAYDFDILDFCHTYNFRAVEVYSALLRLNDFGLIQQNEGLFMPSKIMFRVGNTALYEFQIANAKYDQLIKVILRMYGGELFGNFIKIKEEDLAKITFDSVKEVEKKLEYLASLNVLEYQKRSSLPQIIFINERMDINNLGIDKKLIDERRTLAMEKSEKMVAYCTNTTLCRSRYIQMYFDEQAETDCGTCDICLQRKKEGTFHENIEEKVLAFLDTQIVASLSEVLEYLPKQDPKETAIVVRKMVEGGTLLLVDGLLKINK